ncbi:hypothetical protein [Cellulosimicrobium sp. 22601]|uniref:hypothetical protein n=1 Tax=unclassified Cellulosimicrobium TaxID=2624466 RepID=UPI003F850E28
MSEETVPGRATTASSFFPDPPSPRDMTAVTTPAEFASLTAEEKARLYVQDVDRYRQLRDAAREG